MVKVAAEGVGVGVGVDDVDTLIPSSIAVEPSFNICWPMRGADDVSRTND